MQLTGAISGFCLLLCSAGPAGAGGGPGDESSREESGTHFFGEAKDIAGFRPLEGARVKVAVRGTRMFLVVLTDADGRFRLEGFGRDVRAENVDVTCHMSGYRTVEALRRHTSSDRHAPVEIECLMAPEK